MGDLVGASKAGSDPKALQEASWWSYVGRCAGEDQTALAALYDESSSLVYALVLRMLGNTADAEEVTIDVYMQVWRTAGSYDGSRGSVTAWLLTLARSRAIDRVRSRSGRMQHEREFPERFEVPACTASQEAETEGNERRRRVLAALATLTVEQREVVELAYFSGLSHSELAGKLGQPLGTVKTRIRLGMMKLRKELGVTPEHAHSRD